MGKRSIVIISMLILIGYYIATLIAGYFGDKWMPLADIVYLLLPLLASITGFWAMKSYRSSKQSFSILFLSAGMVCYFIAEVLFVLLGSFLNMPTTPSIADVFYLLAYPLFFIGLLKKILQERVSFSLKKNWPFILLAVVFVVLFSYLSIFSSYDPQDDFLKNLILISYGIGDLILTISCLFILVIVFEYEGGKMSYPWLILNMSFLIMLITDLFYAIYPDEYESIVYIKVILDTCWMLSYMLFSLAMLRSILIVKEHQQFLEERGIK
jgi:hypothetical protein